MTLDSHNRDFFEMAVLLIIYLWAVAGKPFPSAKRLFFFLQGWYEREFFVDSDPCPERLLNLLMKRCNYKTCKTF